MGLAGDEMGRTQLGNNNAYCQDNEIGWINWNLSTRDRKLLQFTRQCLRIFHSNPSLRRRSFFTGRPIADGGVKDLTWVHAGGEEMSQEDWADEENHVLGMLIHGRATDEVNERGRPLYGQTLLLLLNGGPRTRSFTLPRVEGAGAWQEILNTAHPGSRVVKAAAVNLVANSLILLRFGEPA
jgi:glycogen operon protein